MRAATDRIGTQNAENEKQHRINKKTSATQGLELHIAMGGFKVLSPAGSEFRKANSGLGGMQDTRARHGRFEAFG